ncbi:uncharacterized protein LOC130898849 [Diorhabda carinulata]|uniref:uncharacterized protein LOC130898849 n=1 Tax=Diorhabda carinulata TaxID=1163345 RepID=UPI0025A1AA98|nr:uncharacterized protein LOC130898849 [Diorhabda carinulata]
MMDDVTLFKIGTELSELKYNGFWDWFVHVSDIRIHWKNEPTYILSQAAFILGGTLTLLHAIINKGRFPWLWLGAILHGILIENLTYVHPDVDNFWHSQTPIIFAGRRLPLHIIILYPCFIYQAQVAAAKLNLPKWSEPFLVGLLAVLIDIPYDIVSVRYMHWTWHDTDPNIFDRHYWVPWNSYFFHATFAAGFIFWFHYLREKICSTEGKWIADKSFIKEFFCTFLAVLLGSPTGVLAFIAIYHPLHDICNIHSEVTFFIVFVTFALISWTGDRLAILKDYGKYTTTSKLHWSSWILLLHLIVHYVTFMLIPIMFNPEDEVSTGMKEPIGPCNEFVPLHTIVGLTLKKRKYLCPSDYDEGYFDFHCLPNQKYPSDGSIWYTICGIPFKNRAEYITVIGLITLAAAGIFVNLYFNSFGDCVFQKKVNTNNENEKNVLKKKNK